MAFYIHCLTESLAELEASADEALAAPPEADRPKTTKPAKKRTGGTR
jgi:hypothetical protein